MAGMPAMQEQLPAMARDGRYAGNAGAIAGDGPGWLVAFHAGAIAGGIPTGQSTCSKGHSG